MKTTIATIGVIVLVGSPLVFILGDDKIEGAAFRFPPPPKVVPPQEQIQFIPPPVLGQPGVLNFTIDVLPVHSTPRPGPTPLYLQTPQIVNGAIVTCQWWSLGIPNQQMMVVEYNASGARAGYWLWEWGTNFGEVKLNVMSTTPLIMKANWSVLGGVTIQ